MKNAARVLLYDVETSPNIGFTWGRIEQNVIAFIRERMIISIAWKWLDESKVHCAALPHFKTYKKNKHDNRELIKKFHAVMTKADIAISHNGSRFDEKQLSTEFLKHKLKPPTPHKVIDTLIVARRYFRFNSNRLDDLGESLGVGRKLKHEGFDLWLGCLNGDKKAWETMRAYNRQDVVLLERVYKKMLPWISSHPNMTHFSGDRMACSGCGSSNTERRGRVFYAGSSRGRLQCRNCGKWSLGQSVTNRNSQ